jgi:two-component system sensor histidine kinase UhpB
VRVLFVEDCEQYAALLRIYMRKYDEIDYAIVGTLRVAIQTILATRFDVLVVDLGLPDAFGVQSVRSLRSSFPDLPLVVLTGNDSPETAIRAQAEGIDEYLVKHEVDGEEIYGALLASRLRRRVRSGNDER